jgi:hypothetical protein
MAEERIMISFQVQISRISIGRRNLQYIALIKAIMKPISTSTEKTNFIL